MKKSLSLILIIFSSFSFAQQYDDYTTDEKLLIETDSGKMMRVYQRVIPQDSIVLKSVSKEADPTAPLTHLLVKRMELSVLATGGVGIAAPQVGINRRIILVQRFDKENNPFEAFINPKIIWQSELMQLGPEGDLSFDERGDIMRHYAVQIQYHNLNGEITTEILEGFTAVIFQHERDHLDGTLLTDRADEQKSFKFIPAVDKSNLYFYSE